MDHCDPAKFGGVHIGLGVNYSLGSPISGCAIVLMSACLPIPVSPGVIAELRSIFQLPLRYAGSVTTKSSVVFECCPWDGIMAMRAMESSCCYFKGNGNGPLVFHERVNL